MIERDVPAVVERSLMPYWIKRSYVETNHVRSSITTNPESSSVRPKLQLEANRQKGRCGECEGVKGVKSVKLRANPDMTGSQGGPG